MRASFQANLPGASSRASAAVATAAVAAATAATAATDKGVPLLHNGAVGVHAAAGEVPPLKGHLALTRPATVATHRVDESHTAAPTQRGFSYHTDVTSHGRPSTVAARMAHPGTMSYASTFKARDSRLPHQMYPLGLWAFQEARRPTTLRPGVCVWSLVARVAPRRDPRTRDGTRASCRVRIFRVRRVRECCLAPLSTTKRRKKKRRKRSVVHHHRVSRRSTRRRRSAVQLARRRLSKDARRMT